ncbi:Glu/Leu/Phe/Val family dehydrogenase [Pasteuria penetrans]|uniref:Glu/Leu/Phe/Val family dehydrogenase n=1 Tax=Pasteuria penetrans TaxID=86005 RepID=UPI000F9D27C8
MVPFREMEDHGCEQLVFCHDPATQLRAIIAIHDTTLGPALGGLRMLPYATSAEAVRDVVRLAQGMTYKSALAGLPLGGGKAVIIGDSMTDKTPTLIRSFARAVQQLHGVYITAEDMGTTEQDMQEIRDVTPYVTGFRKEAGGSGDPSSLTAYGVFRGIQAALGHKEGSDSLRGKHVALQGAGATSTHLCRYLAKAGAVLTVADYIPERAAYVARNYGATVVDPGILHKTACDVFAPCARGGILNDQTIPQLRCRVIAGSANNQLEDPPRHAAALATRNILYVPDYGINAGGLICVADTMLHGYDEAMIRERVHTIYDTIQVLLDTAQRKFVTPLEVADCMVEDRLRGAREQRKDCPSGFYGPARVRK